MRSQSVKVRQLWTLGILQNIMSSSWHNWVASIVRVCFPFLPQETYFLFKKFQWRISSLKCPILLLSKCINDSLVSRIIKLLLNWSYKKRSNDSWLKTTKTVRHKKFGENFERLKLPSNFLLSQPSFGVKIQLSNFAISFVDIMI